MIRLLLGAIAAAPLLLAVGIVLAMMSTAPPESGYRPDPPNLALTLPNCRDEEFLRERVWAALQAARSCTASSDCRLLGSACPFGCYLAVNAEHGQAVRTAMERWREVIERGACGGCRYRCVPMKSPLAACIDGRCRSVDGDRMALPEPPAPAVSGPSGAP